jgi:diadenosine tetraphosphate (Ap4A) HIT family hydrolase
MSDAFALDPALERDSVLVGHSNAGQVRLHRDARWPWLLLIPERPGLRELHELEEVARAQLWSVSAVISEALLREGPAEGKLNVGVLGNRVAQLHLHHVLRWPGDPAWPDPVWGQPGASVYEAPERAAALWRDRLGALLR